MSAPAQSAYDIIVVGAGIAGASLAAELADGASVLVVEAEREAGYHATGRSAAFWLETYGGPQVQPLTAASGRWLAEHDFLRQRGALTIAREDQADDLSEFVASYDATSAEIVLFEREQLEKHVPGLRSEWRLGAFEPNCRDIDSAALHQYYLKALRRSGGELLLGTNMESARQESGHWLVQLSDGSTIAAQIIVNAAGAWADPVAEACGADPLGIKPFRRTMAQIRTTPAPPRAMPLVTDIAGSFYFKPEGERLWLSPHDEIASPPCDAAPEEIDVALAIDRFEGAVDWQVAALEHKWAGLRSFAPDRLPVYGFDAERAGFFWCAGQGGFGIQTAPAAARMAANIILGRGPDPLTEGLAPQLYSPARFARVA